MEYFGSSATLRVNEPQMFSSYQFTFSLLSQAPNPSSVLPEGQKPSTNKQALKEHFQWKQQLIKTCYHSLELLKH